MQDMTIRPAGLEPAASSLGNWRSIHLSYEREIKSARQFTDLQTQLQVSEKKLATSLFHLRIFLIDYPERSA